MSLSCSNRERLKLFDLEAFSVVPLYQTNLFHLASARKLTPGFDVDNQVNRLRDDPCQNVGWKWIRRLLAKKYNPVQTFQRIVRVDGHRPARMPCVPRFHSGQRFGPANFANQYPVR